MHTELDHQRNQHKAEKRELEEALAIVKEQSQKSHEDDDWVADEIECMKNTLHVKNKHLDEQRKQLNNLHTELDQHKTEKRQLEETLIINEAHSLKCHETVDWIADEMTSMKNSLYAKNQQLEQSNSLVEEQKKKIDKLVAALRSANDIIEQKDQSIMRLQKDLQSTWDSLISSQKLMGESVIVPLRQLITRKASRCMSSRSRSLPELRTIFENSYKCIIAVCKSDLMSKEEEERFSKKDRLIS